MATDAMPLSRAARMTRTAISPRLAMRTLEMRGIIIQLIGGAPEPFWAGPTKRLPCRCRCLQAAIPERRPRNPKREQKFAGESERQADDCVRVAVHLADERPPETVDGECASDLERLA